MRSLMIGFWVVVFLTTSISGDTTGRSGRSLKTASKRSVKAKGVRRGRVCNVCPAKSTRNGSRSAKAVACNRRGYVNPAIARNYNAAMRDLRRAGIEPRVTSTWRSSAHQARLHRCSNSRRCRRAHPGLYFARPAGSSLHEAGFAVDMSGVAIGPRGAKRLTPRGRRIVAIMRRNGFVWRYGLADPAHFEIDPTRYGYSSTQQAIRRSQSACQQPYIARAGRKGGVARRIVARNR